MTDPSTGPARSRKIGIVLDDFVGLAGATDFLVSVIDALHRARPQWQLVFIASQAPRAWSRLAVERRLRQWVKAAIARRRPPPPPPPPDLQGFLDRLDASLTREPLLRPAHGGDALAACAGENGIEALLPFAVALPADFAVPWVGYLYDFQHRYFPDLFTERERRWRDASFARMLDASPSVIVNAHSVGQDAARFCAPFRARIFVLPFSAAADPRWFAATSRDVRVRYGIDGPYFIVSNQFWVHKRHDVAIEAFAEVARRHPDLSLICTGATEDARAPHHLARLVRLVDGAGLQGRVRFLGLIPKTDQIALLRGAVAVVQPTEFEGGPGGGAVFDAVATGVRSIVSDIPVNREIEPYVTRYFAPNDVAQLAKVMEDVLAAPAVEVDVAVLRGQGEERRTAMGAVLAAAIDHAIGSMRAKAER